MLDEKLIEGFACVEGFHDVVAVSPRSAKRDVLIKAVRVGVAGDIEPVAAPFFTVVRREQQPVDDFFEGIRRWVGEEGINLVRRGRQAGEVEGGAADEHALLGGRGERKALFGEFYADEGVDRVPRLQRRHFRLRNRAEGPVLAAVLDVDHARSGVLCVGDRLTRIGCAHEYPFLQRFHFGGWEGSFRRHLQILVLVADGFDDVALFEIARDERGAGVAAFEDGLAGVD